MTARTGRLGAVLLGAALLAACEAPAPRTGRAEATADTTITLALGRRTLVLDGTAGDVTLVADTAVTAATLRLTRRARGATRASAARRLAGVTVSTASDHEMEQVVWRAAPAEGAGVSARVSLPPDAHVVVHLDAGDVTARGLAGPLDVETGRGAVRLAAHAGRRLRVRIGDGAATLGARAVPADALWFVSLGAGDAAVHLPADASATVVATADTLATSAGAVVGQARAGAGARRQLRLGAGEAVVRVETARGRVTVR